MSRSKARQSGFALLAVIWTLGLITLLGMVAIVGARYRIKTFSSFTAVAAAEVAAESAVNLAISASLTAPPEQTVRFPLRCRLPGGELATITIEDEAGKVDLNTATPDVLMRLFSALTGDQSAGALIASNVIAFHKRQAQDERTPTAGPAEPRFTTVMQLDQVRGMSPQLFRAALRHVTVRSGRPAPDIDAASPVLLKLLDIEPKQAPAGRPLIAGGSMTIRADINASNGTRFIREALVTLDVANGRPFVIREWRHGEIDPSNSPQEGSARACLQVRNSATG